MLLSICLFHSQFIIQVKAAVMRIISLGSFITINKTSKHLGRTCCAVEENVAELCFNLYAVFPLFCRSIRAALIYRNSDLLHVILQQTHVSRVNLLYMLHIWQQRTLMLFCSDPQPLNVPHIQTVFLIYICKKKYIFLICLTLAKCGSHQSKPHICS